MNIVIWKFDFYLKIVYFFYQVNKIEKNLLVYYCYFKLVN